MIRPLPLSAITAPTEGFGQHWPSPRRPRASARVIAERSQGLSCSARLASSARLLMPLIGCKAHGADPLLRFGARRTRTSHRAGDLAEHRLEVARLAEILVDRGEAHIGHWIELAQFLHHHLADGLG